MKLRAKLEAIRTLSPNRSAFGQLYKEKSETQGRWRKVTLWTLFESSEDTHLLRPHVFESKREPRDARAWDEWFRRNLTEIQSKVIVPGINQRTDKIWRVQRILGWQANVVSESRIARLSRRRDQTIHKRRKNG